MFGVLFFALNLAAPATAASTGIAYFVAAPTPVYVARGSTTEIGRLDRFDLPLVIEAQAGWIHVRVMGEPEVTPDGDAWPESYEGWIKAGPSNARNLVPDPVDARFRIREVRSSGSRWPAATQDEVVRGRVRPGFTKAQVKAAKRGPDNVDGDPLRQRISETAAGTREVWTYRDMQVTLNGERVVEVETIK